MGMKIVGLLNQNKLSIKPRSWDCEPEHTRAGLGVGFRRCSMGLGATKGAGGCTYGNRRVLLPFRVLFRIQRQI